MRSRRWHSSGIDGNRKAPTSGGTLEPFNSAPIPGDGEPETQTLIAKALDSNSSQSHACTTTLPELLPQLREEAPLKQGNRGADALARKVMSHAVSKATAPKLRVDTPVKNESMPYTKNLELMVVSYIWGHAGFLQSTVSSRTPAIWRAAI